MTLSTNLLSSIIYELPRLLNGNDTDCVDKKNGEEYEGGKAGNLCDGTIKLGLLKYVYLVSFVF